MTWYIICDIDKEVNQMLKNLERKREHNTEQFYVTL